MQAESDDVRLNATRSRFETGAGEALAVAEFRLRDGRMVLTHTEVPVTRRGHHVADRLAAAALAYARANQLTVVPACPFMAAYIARHPEHDDLIAPHEP